MAAEVEHCQGEHPMATYFEWIARTAVSRGRNPWGANWSLRVWPLWSLRV